jgi:Tfp pilus assembly protein PilZ
MSQLVEELERRDAPRVRLRLACSLLIGGQCHPATVRDFSQGGFFVETDADLRRGSGVIVTVSGPDGARFLLETYVPRNPALTRGRPYRVRTGVGLQIEDPPESYLRWIEKFAS